MLVSDGCPVTWLPYKANLCRKTLSDWFALKRAALRFIAEADDKSRQAFMPRSRLVAAGFSVRCCLIIDLFACVLVTSRQSLGLAKFKPALCYRFVLEQRGSYVDEQASVASRACE